MRIEINGNNVEITDLLRRYAESRVWLAVQRAAGRVSWIGVRFIRADAAAAKHDPRVTCEVDVWLRGTGLMTVRHADANPYVALNISLLKLKRSLVNKLRAAEDDDNAEAGTQLDRLPAAQAREEVLA